MVSHKDTLFKYYDVVGIQENNFVARFMSKKEALLAQKWLNEELFGYEYAKIQVQNVNYNNMWEFKNQHTFGITHSTAKDFILYIKEKSKQRENSKYYECKKGNKAFVKIENYWWELDTKTPLDNAIVYNRSGGRMTEIDVTKESIVEAKDWEYLDWFGTCIYDKKYKTGWLSPDGKLYGCDYRCHSSQANLVHKKTEEQLETSGWIKLTYSLGNTNKLMAYVGSDKYRRLIPPTDEQFEYLSKCKLHNYPDIKYLYSKKYNDEDLQL